MRAFRWTVGLVGIVTLVFGLSILVGRSTGALPDKGLEPGWEWLIQNEPAWFRTMFWALALGPAMLLASALPSTRPGGMGRQLCGFGVVALLLLGAGLHWACGLFPPLEVERSAAGQQPRGPHQESGGAERRSVRPCPRCALPLTKGRGFAPPSCAKLSLRSMAHPPLMPTAPS